MHYSCFLQICVVIILFYFFQLFKAAKVQLFVSAESRGPTITVSRINFNIFWQLLMLLALLEKKKHWWTPTTTTSRLRGAAAAFFLFVLTFPHAMSRTMYLPSSPLLLPVQCCEALVNLNEAVCVFAVHVNPHTDTEAGDLQDCSCGDDPEPEPAAVQWAERTQANSISSFLLATFFCCCQVWLLCTVNLMWQTGCFPKILWISSRSHGEIVEEEEDKSEADCFLAVINVSVLSAGSLC